MSKILKSLKDLLKGRGYYQCLHCGYILPKEDATISGYDSESSLRHVHCPRCERNVPHLA